MGGEGRRLACQEAEEEEGLARGAGARAEQPRRADQVRHDPPLARRTPAGQWDGRGVAETTFSDAFGYKNVIDCSKINGTCIECWAARALNFQSIRLASDCKLTSN